MSMVTSSPIKTARFSYLLPLLRKVLASGVVLLLTAPATSAFSSDQSDPFTSNLEPLTFQTRAIGGPDSDGDGIRNQDDLDDDNDGILDILEKGYDDDGDGFPDSRSVDTDGDQIPDILDLDSDNDGILDMYEARLSREAVKALDLVPNGAIDIAFSVGSNGLADIIETSLDSGLSQFDLPDTDGDGIADFIDRDSDNDGIYDVIEAGGTDNDTDGRLDGFFDADGKGVDDTVQASALPLFDTDGDGVMDFRDLDSDNDTVPDAVEGGGSASFPTDTDQDGAPDYRESDSDGDGIGDHQEVGSNVLVPQDSDGNGIPDYQDSASNPDRSDDPNDSPNPSPDDNRPDRDADGIANQDDLDDDNDTILDSQEGIIDADGDGVADANSRDSDGDGVPDGNDLDSDNDGILDIYEARFSDQVVQSLDLRNVGAVAISFEVGSNGIPDLIESSPDSGVINESIFDTDNDGTPDFMDVDSDNDGIADLVEAGGIDINADGRIDGFSDADSKGVDDATQATALPRFDTDRDGNPDYRDTDSDGDGLSDNTEAGSNPSFPQDTDGDGAADYREQDSDNDGVSDNTEAGPDLTRPVDSNGDGVADFQDSSVQFTGAGVPNVPGDSANNDQDNDGQNDSLDTDDDNDGIPDVVEGQADSDSDGVVNRLDLDSDNDGIFDSIEGSGDPDADSVPNFLDLDSDNDGLYDALEAGRVIVTAAGRLASAASVNELGLASGSSDQLLDTDGDGVPDYLDLDSDNDGLFDVLEAGLADANLDARLDNVSDNNKDGADDSLTSLGIRLQDSDSDRLPDSRDLDSDQDSLADRVENNGVASDQNNDGKVDNFIDANADGLDDNVAAQPSALLDSDNDGLPNIIDLDSDGDGVSDLVEAGGKDENGDGQSDLLADDDGDGIPDQNDSDITGGADSDNDSIDDSVDSDFSNESDTDGDGVVDSSDPDSDGNGFVGPSDEGDSGPSQGDPVNLPDDDADGVPDINQSIKGSIETGLGGAGVGCSVVAAKANGSFDPSFWLLLAVSAMYFLARRQRRLSKAVIATAATGIALTGCSLLESPRDRYFEPRVYGGLGALVSQVEPDTDKVEGVSVDDSQGAGLSAMVGYDFNNRFSVEGHVADLGEATLTPDGKIGYTVAGVSGVIYGLNDARDRSRRVGFSGYGRLGLGALSNSASGVTYRRVNDVHLLVGLGMEYGLENGLGIRAELTAHETDAKYAQLGMVYRFGGRAAPGPSRSGNGRSTSSNSGVSMPGNEVKPVVPSTDSSIDNLDDGLTVVPYDTDGDGVVGDADLCQNTQPGLPVREDGCAVFDGAIEGIAFQPGSDILTPEALTVLSDVARTLLDYSALSVTIEAHTDNAGEAADNLQLSKRRAISVARFLVDQGVSGSRLKPQAYGESRPRATNSTPEGRAENRRVEFSVIQ